MADVMPPPAQGFEQAFPVVIVGAGGTGLCAALAAADAGAQVLVLERDATPRGSTAMSTGLIPAAGTPEQAASGIADSPEQFRDDMLRKTKGSTDPAMALLLAAESAETIRWLRDDHGVPLALMDGWLYPGHSAKRMYGTPHRTGGELMAALESAAAQADIPVLADATVDRIYAQGDRIVGVSVLRPGGEREDIGCMAVVLACSGFGGNADLVARFIPEMAGAVYHGHAGNRGDALLWGQALGAETADIDAYQGHGGLAAGHGVPILWPTITEGGFQANLAGLRFSNEAAGYSEQAAIVNAQPRQLAWTIYDARCHRLMLDFDDYRDALRAGAVLEATDEADLARRTGLPMAALSQTLADVRAATLGTAPDRFLRDFTGKPVLAPPYYAAKVTGALFHTQGGLAVDATARVRKLGGGVFANLFAGGGAARGVSGRGSAGYLAGNGQLAATTLGRLAGHYAALMTADCSAAEQRIFPG
jgi:fumarate reductase flavoprotein subunit